MPKSLLEIISPLKTVLNKELYDELVAFCHKDQSVNVRARLASELEKLSVDNPNAPIIYEAAKQITHEYPLNTECPLTHEPIQWGEGEADKYVFSALSGHVYERISLLQALRIRATDPMINLPYSDYELEQLGIPTQQPRSNVQNQDVQNPVVEQRDWCLEDEASYAVYGCSRVTALTRATFISFISILTYMILVGELGGQRRAQVFTLNSMIPLMLITLVTHYLCKDYYSLSLRAREAETSARHMDEARMAGLQGGAWMLIPLTIAAYGILGIEVVGGIKSATGDSSISAQGIGGLAGGAYGLLLSLIAFNAACKLRHLRADTPAETDVEIASRRTLLLAQHAIAGPIILGALGALIGALMGQREYGAMAGAFLGFFMTGVNAARNYRPSLTETNHINVPLLRIGTH